MSTPRKTAKGQAQASPAADARRSQAVALLLAGNSVHDIAVALNVSRPTVSTWLGEPDVRAELERANAEIIDDAVAKLQRLSTKAVDALETLMGPGQEPSARLGAAKTVLDRIGKLSGKVSVEHSGEVRAPIIIVESAVDIQAMRSKARALEARTSEQEADSDSD